MKLKVKLKSKQIQIYFIRQNLSQNGVARKMGICSGYISQLMNGKRFASARVRIKLQKIFADKTWDDLFEIIERKKIEEER